MLTGAHPSGGGALGHPEVDVAGVEQRDPPRVTRTVHVAAYGARVTVTAESADDVCDRLAGLLPPGAVGPARDDTDVRYEIHDDVPGDPARGPRYRVSRDGSPCFEADTAQDVAARLRSLVDLDLAVHARDGLAIHAGAVAWRDHGILIPGRSGTGKSSLVAELVRLGATYYSDELAVLDDEGRLHPYARPLCLRDEGTGADRRVAPAQLGAVGQAPVPVSLVVSTAYREDAGWKPATITGARAAMPLIDNAVLAREDPVRTLRIASVLAPTLVTLQGARPAVQTVAPAILRFVDDMAAGREGVRLPRFLRVEHFLEPDELRRLLDVAVAHQADDMPSRVDPGTGARVDPGCRRSRTIDDLAPVWGLFARRLPRLLPFLRAELGIPWFPVGQLERQLTLHQDGDFFKVHPDNGTPGTAARRLTAVFHFHREPRAFAGGELCLYSTLMRGGVASVGPLHARLEPRGNSVVFFPSDVYHEVLPVRAASPELGAICGAVTIWVREGSRPARLDAVLAATASHR